MAVEVVAGTPLAEALQNVVQPKLVEVGWSADQDDNTLSEYIILMLVNGKNQDQIASELSNDLLNLDPNDTGAQDFARWLFEQVESLNAQINGVQQSNVGGEQNSTNISSSIEPAQDADMGDAGDTSQASIPTGPKAMRNGNQRGRDTRMFGQINKAMDRSGDGALHRVRASPGAGRINSHSREPPKGPRNQSGRGMNQTMGNGRQPHQNQMPQMSSNGPAHPFMAMSPQQQMQIFAMYEEQAKMMQQMFTAQGFNGQGFNPNSAQGTQGNSGKSLFDRVQNKPQKSFDKFSNQRHPRKAHNENHQDMEMGDDNTGATNNAASTSMDMDTSQAKDPAETVCKFNLSCAKPDCPFAHQSPAAPPGTAVDVNDECSFGVACTNRKCVARHPSPSKRNSHLAEQDCKFWPNCTNPNCGFKHPTMPVCRNGGDCTVPNCKFSHSKITCKFNPCLNPSCMYKHAEGQKRGAFNDKVWKAGDDKNEHVSERKFVDEDGEEELILPGKATQEAEGAEVIT